MKSFLKKTVAYPFLKKLNRALNSWRRHPLQNHKTTSGFNIIHLGTEYGGWSFVDEDCLDGCTIISAGLGEDASFDIEFAARYNAKIILIDPTPRAIAYFEKIRACFGANPSQQYSDSGRQPISAYDLSRVTDDNFKLIEKALWNENKYLRFYEPPNQEHISHSIINFQNDYSSETRYIEVEAVTLDKLLNDLKLRASDIPLMKFDIEGAEIEVLTRCMTLGIFPRQILVEFDELNVSSSKGFKRVTNMNEMLESKGYKLLQTNGQADFLYYRS